LTKEKGQKEVWIIARQAPDPMGEPGLPAYCAYSNRKPARLEQRGNKDEIFPVRTIITGKHFLENQLSKPK
jgi:hypothetical protein